MRNRSEILTGTLTVLLLASFSSHAQKQYNQWYFGYGAALNFNSGSPVPLLNNAITTDEGGASISDSAGNLLFYTNGEVVMNRLHQQMPNGSGLGGHFSSTQSALIVPFPDDNSLYYVFTVPAQITYFTGGNAGFCYSIIDMQLNGGLGDVTTRNVLLTDSVMEKLTAIRHHNGKDVWVVVHKWNSDAYYAYLITCDVIQAPVVSNAGRIMTDVIAADFHASLGCMKISPAGKKIASTWSIFDPQFTGTSYMDILDFNNETGEISNPVSITHQNVDDDIRGYGVSFSPAGTKLYLSEYGLVNGIGFGRVLQFDMLSANIPASETQVGYAFNAFGTMQIAPDGMIYIAREGFLTYLSRIQNPEASGTACGFDEPGVSLGLKPSTWGLPNNWDTFPKEEVYDIFPFTDTTLCFSQFLELHATYRYHYYTPAYEWSNGSTDSVIVVSQEGMYWANIIFSCDTISDTIYLHKNEFDVNLGNDTALCSGQLVLDAGITGADYQWSTGETSQQITIQDYPQLIWVTVSKDGCPAQDSINIVSGCGIFIPNAFTPNNDGLNDLFEINGQDLVSFEIKIFNRWGQMVFFNTDINESWDGTFKEAYQETGTYVYFARAQSGSGKEYFLKGNILLIR